MNDTKPKERPILFSGPMVRAILDGRKTQTRRAIQERVLDRLVFENHPAFFIDAVNSCTFGTPGDRLWVRETFAILNQYGANADIKHSGGRQHKVTILYRAAEGPRHYLDPDCEKVLLEDREIEWRPSIHMPRWASRITLEITGVRVERLQEISEADAQNEGWPGETVGTTITDFNADTPRYWYRELWNAIHGPDAWDRNDWVWVVEFKRVEVPS